MLLIAMLLSLFDDSSCIPVGTASLIDSFTLFVYSFVDDRLLTVCETALAVLSTLSKSFTWITCLWQRLSHLKVLKAQLHFIRKYMPVL